jgi:protochlorophyllide reductase
MASRDTDAPRTAVVTGATRGLGLHAARTIASTPGWRVVLAVRDVEAGRRVAAGLGEGTDVVALDLASLASVHAAAADLIAGHAPLDALVLNAGIQVTRADRATADGFELTFGVNHLGHFLLAGLLSDALAPAARIVAVSSGTHFGTLRKSGPYPRPRWRPVRELATPDGGSGQVAYATSKLANVLFAYEAARRLEGRATVNAFDPGLMPSTGLARDYPPRVQRLYARLAPAIERFLPGAARPEDSGRALAQLATDPRWAGVTGRYVEIDRELRSAPATYDLERAADLWRESAALTGLAPQADGTAIPAGSGSSSAPDPSP